MVDQIPSVDSETLRFPAPVRAALAADVSDPETEIGGALSATFVSRAGVPLNVLDFGAVADGATDCTPAFTAALAALPAGGGAIYVPPGVYACASTIAVTKAVRIFGAAHGHAEGTVTQLLFPHAVKGIEVTAPTWRYKFIMEDITLTSAASAYSAGKHGLHIKRASAYLANVTVEYFSDHGIFFDTTGYTVPTPDNTDFSYAVGLRAYGCRGDGIRTEGIDSNAITIVNADVVANYGWGINNLGRHNVFLHPHADQQYNSSPGAFRDANQSNFWHDCYAEASGAFKIDTGSSAGFLSDSTFGAVALTIVPAAHGWEIVRANGVRDSLRITKQDSVGAHAYSLGQVNGAGRLDLYDDTRGDYIFTILGDGSVMYYKIGLRPVADLTYQFGGSSERWSAGYFGTIDASVHLKTGAYATGSRPAASTAGAGAMVYDTTLSKPIWSNGTVWKDAAGTTV